MVAAKEGGLSCNALQCDRPAADQSTLATQLQCRLVTCSLRLDSLEQLLKESFSGRSPNLPLTGHIVHHPTHPPALLKPMYYTHFSARPVREGGRFKSWHCQECTHGQDFLADLIKCTEANIKLYLTPNSVQFSPKSDYSTSIGWHFPYLIWNSIPK